MADASLNSLVNARHKAFLELQKAKEEKAIARKKMKNICFKLRKKLGFAEERLAMITSENDKKLKEYNQEVAYYREQVGYFFNQNHTHYEAMKTAKQDMLAHSIENDLVGASEKKKLADELRIQAEEDDRQAQYWLEKKRQCQEEYYAWKKEHPVDKELCLAEKAKIDEIHAMIHQAIQDYEMVKKALQEKQTAYNLAEKAYNEARSHQ